MLKFMVVIHQRPGMQGRISATLDGSSWAPANGLADRRKYAQNHVGADRKRNSPGWDPVIELYFDDWAAMEVAWASREGGASDSDLPAFAELTRATCSVADEIMVLE
jgi:hypothetical protein